MNQTDFERFVETLSACADLYGKTLGEPALRIWWQTMERFDFREFDRALRRCIESPDTGQFMPKPADVIRHIDGSSSDRALVAWGRVFDAMSRVGAYSSVDFAEPAIHAAIVDLGGWVKLCRSEEDELPFIQKRFCDAYRTYSSRGSVNAPLRLAGDHEIANAGKGYEIEPSVALISNGNTKIGPDAYKKHFLGLSDNVTFFVEQIEQVPASPYRYRVIFKPDVIVPDVNLSTGISK